MTFGESVSTCFRKYADFTGRASRSQFWSLVVFIAVVEIPVIAWGSAV